MIFLLLLYQIIPFESRNDNLLKEYSKDASVDASGSIGQWYEGKCHQTHVEDVIDDVERKTDWCSNINKSSTDYPWMNINLRGKAMKLTGYAIRSGCCYYDCCCYDDKTYYCCCWLYSWSLQGSHDNRTWTTLHSVKADNKFYYCANRKYEIQTNDAYEYIRLIQDEPWPGCDYCICLNKIELYGSATSGYFNSFEDGENDDTVSIIGKVKSLNN